MDRRITTRAAVGAAWFERFEPRTLLASVGPVVYDSVVRMETSLGRITVELTPDATPLTVANFLRYVRGNRYANTLVHRSIPGFVIQGGGYKNLGPDYPHIATFPAIPNEFTGARLDVGGGKVNVRGTIAMAKFPDPDSATSEWFVNLADNSDNLDNPANSGGFTVFGHVIAGGMNTVDAIAGLSVINAASANSSFVTLPVTGAGGIKPVVVRAVHTVEELPVHINASVRTVRWVDENGAAATLNLSAGAADLKFTGTDLRATVSAGKVLVTGSGVSLAGVIAYKTTAATTLSVSSTGGAAPAGVGDVSVTGALNRFNAASVRLDGDITITGRAARLDIGQSNRAHINANGTGGPLAVHIARALDTSLSTTQRLASLDVDTWQQGKTQSATISASVINRVSLGGRFQGSIQGGASIADLHTTGGLFNATVNATSIQKLRTEGAIDGSQITAANGIGSVTAAAMSGSSVAAGSLFGNAGQPHAPVTLGRLEVTGVFAGSNVAAPAITTLRLGRINTANHGSIFGVQVTDRIGHLDAVIAGKTVAMRNLSGQPAVTQYFSSRKIHTGDFRVTFDDVNYLL